MSLSRKHVKNNSCVMTLRKVYLARSINNLNRIN